MRGLKNILGHCGVWPGFAVIMVVAALASAPANAAPVAVQFPEGVAHGFLLVRSLAGKIIGQGEMIQVVKENGLVESRLVFNFKDGSLHDEKVTFSQQRVFTMIRYRLVQHGPFFPDQIDVLMDRNTGDYVVRSTAGKDGKNGKEDVLTGAFELPPDAYNGMFVTILHNLPRGTSETVGFLAFTPAPEIIKLDLRPIGEQTVRIGDLSRKALQYVFEPDIGMIRELLGKATGRLPAHFHYKCWILAAEVPSFVHFEGPLQLMGPIVRIELVSPQLSPTSEDQKHSSQ